MSPGIPFMPPLHATYPISHAHHAPSFNPTMLPPAATISPHLAPCRPSTGIKKKRPTLKADLLIYVLILEHFRFIVLLRCCRTLTAWASRTPVIATWTSVVALTAVVTARTTLAVITARTSVTATWTTLRLDITLRLLKESLA